MNTETAKALGGLIKSSVMTIVGTVCAILLFEYRAVWPGLLFTALSLYSIIALKMRITVYQRILRSSRRD